MLGLDERTQQALDLAYSYLNRRDRSETEVRRRLERHGIEAAAIEEAITMLLDQRLLDDVRFARLFAEDKRELAQWGSERIRRSLTERGVSRELIDQTLGATSDQTELDRALELLRRRFPSPPADRRERDRALGVMLRKGYDTELALDALAAYRTDAGAGDLR